MFAKCVSKDGYVWCQQNLFMQVSSFHGGGSKTRQCDVLLTSTHLTF